MITLLLWPKQVVLEGNLVNMDVTSPAATLALALMYLKTNDAAIAASFFVPDTHFALDYVKPEFVLLRVLARGLVMWDSVQPTREWLQSQLPDLIKVREQTLCQSHAKQLRLQDPMKKKSG